MCRPQFKNLWFFEATSYGHWGHWGLNPRSIAGILFKLSLPYLIFAEFRRWVRLTPPQAAICKNSPVRLSACRFSAYLPNHAVYLLNFAA